MSPLSPLSLWNEILRQFGDQSSIVQICTSEKKNSPIARIPQINGENGDNGDNDSRRSCESEDQRRPDRDTNGDKPKGEYKLVLIQKDVDLFVGVDGLNYLLHRQDVASIPAVHARNLIRSGHAVEINPGLGPHPRREAGA